VPDYNNLTTTQKDKKIKRLVERDGGDLCFYCVKLGKDPKFVHGDKNLRRTIDHLVNKKGYNQLENLVLAHWICNEKKKDTPEMQVMGNEKLKENQRNADLQPLIEKEEEEQRIAKKETSELKEVDMNLIVNKIAKAYLAEKIPEANNSNIYYSQALNSIHYLTIEQTGGRGSDQAARRSLDAFCSEYSPWESYIDGSGKRMIKRRKNYDIQQNVL
jgi:ribonuclease HII